MANMQEIIDKAPVGTLVFVAHPTLLDMSSLAQDIESGFVEEVLPESHGVAVSQCGQPWRDNGVSGGLHRHFHDAEEIIVSEEWMQEVLWRAYKNACWRTQDQRVDITELASVFGFDCAGNPVVCFAHVSGLDDSGEPEFYYLPAPVNPKCGGQIVSVDVFAADDGVSLVSTCLSKVRGYFV